MNRFTRYIGIAGAAGLAAIGSIAVSPAISGAQEDDTGTDAPTTSQQDTEAPATSEQDPGAESPEGCERGGRRHRGPGLDVAAAAIGIDVEQLREELQGATLAAVAGDHGVDAQAVTDALVADVAEHLSERVADGEIDQAEADQRLADATERLADRVENGRPERAERRPGPAADTPGDDQADEPVGS